MKRSPEVLLRNVVYASLAWFLTHYAYVIPITMTGSWQGILVPGQNLVSVSGHVMFICLIWLIFRSRRATMIATIAMLILGFLSYQCFAGWPTVGMRNFAVCWLMVILQTFVAPLLAFAAVSLEPRVSKLIFKEVDNAC
jgi:hypothetical protein